MTLTLRNVEYVWPSSGFGLSLESLEIRAGEKVLLTAPSGAGKSTLLSLIAGLIPAKSGEILVQGRDLVPLSARERDKQRADQIGFIFQSLNLLPYLSAVENILVPLHFSPARRKAAGGLRAARHKAEALMAEIGLPPERFGAMRARDLSIGQQQRIAALRAVIGDPALLIADEPTSALDTDARGQFIDMLLSQSAHSGAAILMVSHDPALAPHFERRLALSDIARTTGASR